ncbi:MAG: 4-hydroxybenzoate octaprenyltransferase, partial [candidate division WOR-3 bacterium]
SYQMKPLLRFIKVEHTLFSLPYLFAGAFLAKRDFTDARETGLILLAGISARAAGMALNRIIDRRTDALNPRTRQRELPAGRLSLWSAWLLVAVSSAIFVFSAWLLNPLCFFLSPIPLLAFWAYPFTKRFTPLTHFALGAAWSIAPAGGWLAVRGNLEGFAPAAILSASVLLWLAGFDIIYALLDLEFDRAYGIKSLPAKMGPDWALVVSLACHIITYTLWIFLGFILNMGPPYFAAMVFVGLMFALEHRFARHKPEFAFFRANAIIGFAFLMGIAGSIFSHGSYR